MRISRARLVLIAMLVLSSASLGWYYYDLYGRYYFQQKQLNQIIQNQEAARLANSAQYPAKSNLIAGNSRSLPDLALDRAVPVLYPRPKSDWKYTEKSNYQKLLSNGKFDVLVVPFQVQEYALDRPTRSLMTAELALTISVGLKLKVPDPYLVARALGEGERRVDPDEVYGLAEKIGAKKIIWGYVGHNRNNKMALSILSQERGINGILNAQTNLVEKKFSNIQFSDEQPPIEVYQTLLPEILATTMLPEILATAGVDRPVLSSSKSSSHFDAIKLPSSPLAMLDEKPEPARDALYFQLLAYLAPDAERTQERFAEKSYLAILSLSPDSPDYKVLKARALMLLGLRPAALHVLGERITIEEKELAAMLNGNLPDIELYSSRMKPGIYRILAIREANYLDSIYAGADKNKSTKVATSLKLPGDIWPFLAVRAFSEFDNWAQFDNIYVKQLLDHEFPIKDYTAEGMIRGAASLGDVGKLQTMVDLSVVNHIRKLLEINAEKWCCQFTIDHPTAWDYLNLIESIGEDDLIRRSDFFGYIQGDPSRALEFLNQIESVFKGHPRFALARGLAQIQRANAADGAEKDGLLKSAYDNLFNVMYWEQGQSVFSDRAFSYLSSTGRNDYGNLDNFYVSDYPFRPYYNQWEMDNQRQITNAEAALRNSTSELKPLGYLDWYFTEISKQAGKHDALLKSIEGRFAGNPVMYQLLAKNSIRNGDVRSAEKYYRESIKIQPITWQAYIDLGKMLIEQGQLARAAKLFMGYPSFKKGSKDNPVGISNFAYEAGSKFYWMGEFSLAAPLYKIASRQETGSGGDITSRIRLDLISGDFRGAIAGTLERANRYNDSYAYRDYLAMLHAMGVSKEAWDAFNMLVKQFDDSHVWEAALVGHRKESKTETEITTWVKQQATHTKDRNINREARYLLRAGVTDRVPSKELVESLIDIERPAWKVFGPDGKVIQPGWEGNMIPGTGYYSLERVRIKSSLVYFAESYRAIRNGDFAEAKKLMDEASTIYDLSDDDQCYSNHCYLLPYYAFAAAKAGDASAVEKLMASFSVEKRGFDYLLAKAVIAGIGGKTIESVQFLKSALYRRPFTEDRPLQTEYEYAEICVWLYEATGEAQFKEEALDWAKKNQKFQPWFAWAYAMEAVLSYNQEERKRAIAMAFYLDPKSEMLNKINKKERHGAIKEYKGRNPFLTINNTDIQNPI